MKLTAKDQQGWSLVHHVVAPIEEASYDNVAMLKLLSDAGAPLSEKDMTGLTPLDYALRQNAPELAKALQKLLKKSHWVCLNTSLLYIGYIQSVMFNVCNIAKEHVFISLCKKI